MQAYQPHEPVIVYGNFKSRLIFYNQEFHPEEIELLQKFKDLCKKKGVRVPDCEPEILKTLYTAKFDIDKAFGMLQQKGTVRIFQGHVRRYVLKAFRSTMESRFRLWTSFQCMAFFQ